MYQKWLKFVLTLYKQSSNKVRTKFELCWKVREKWTFPRDFSRERKITALRNDTNTLICTCLSTARSLPMRLFLVGEIFTPKKRPQSSNNVRNLTSGKRVITTLNETGLKRGLGTLSEKISNFVTTLLQLCYNKVQTKFKQSSNFVYTKLVQSSNFVDKVRTM